jgi:hypothetical protein
LKLQLKASVDFGKILLSLDFFVTFCIKTKSKNCIKSFGACALAGSSRHRRDALFQEKRTLKKLVLPDH